MKKKDKVTDIGYLGMAKEILEFDDFDIVWEGDGDGVLWHFYAKNDKGQERLEEFKAMGEEAFFRKLTRFIKDFKEE